MTVRLSKGGGYWTIELWSGDELVESYTGEASAAGAIERARDFMTRIEFVAMVAGKGVGA